MVLLLKEEEEEEEERQPFWGPLRGSGAVLCRQPTVDSVDSAELVDPPLMESEAELLLETLYPLVLIDGRDVGPFRLSWKAVGSSLE